MVYLEQFVFILLKISAVLTKGSPPASSLPQSPSSFNGICMMLREGLGPDLWLRGQRGSWEITFPGTLDFLQLEAVAGGSALVSVKLPLH